MNVAVNKLPAVAILLFCSGTAFAQTVSFENRLPIEGYSQPGRLATLAAATSGIVAERVAREGGSVKRGDVITRLDATIHNELVELARIAMDSKGENAAARADLQSSLSRLQRIEALSNRSHASEVELMQAQEQVAAAEAGMLVVQEKQLQRKAEHQKLLAEANLYAIKAPFDGVLVKYTKQTGEYVGAADPSVCVLAELDELSIEFLVPRPRRKEITLHSDATVLFTDTDQNATGKVVYVSPYPSGESNLYTVKVRIDNKARNHDAGMRCQLVSARGPESLAKTER